MSSESSHSGSDRENDKAPAANDDTIASDLVVTKYMMAAEITNRVLSEVLDRCVPGASVRDTCVFGDRRIEEETSNIFKKKKDMKKGIATPTCVSLNNQVAHFSPMLCDSDAFMENGDLVKVELGCHIDGFPAIVAHSFVLGTERDKIAGRRADVMHAAYNAMQAALRLIKPGANNRTVAKALSNVASQFDCRMLEGWASFQISQNDTEDEKTICNIPPNAKNDTQEKYDFETNEVYGLDIVVSTGEGRARETEIRTTVHRKRNIIYPLRMKASRALVYEVERRFGNMPFSLRSMENETNARLGVSECVNHSVMQPYPVTAEKGGEYVARFMTTLLLLPAGPRAVTGAPVDLKNLVTEHTIQDEELKALIARPLPSFDKRKRRKKARHATPESAPTGNV